MQKNISTQTAGIFPIKNIYTKNESYFEILINPQSILHY